MSVFVCISCVFMHVWLVLKYLVQVIYIFTYFIFTLYTIKLSLADQFLFFPYIYCVVPLRSSILVYIDQSPKLFLYGTLLKLISLLWVQFGWFGSNLWFNSYNEMKFENCFWKGYASHNYSFVCMTELSPFHSSLSLCYKSFWFFSLAHNIVHLYLGVSTDFLFYGYLWNWDNNFVSAPIFELLRCQPRLIP